MRSTWVIAVNELSNLLKSKLILIMCAVYVLLFIPSVTGLHVPGDPADAQTLDWLRIMGITDSDYYTCILLHDIGSTLWYFGAFFGIVLGVYTVSVERYGKTLSGLLTKPLRRSAVINGKLLGCSLFILSAFILTILVYTGCIMAWWGNAFSPLAVAYFTRLPIIAAVSLIYVLFFFAMSLLISLIVTDLAVALILSMLAKLFLVDAGRSLSGFQYLVPDTIMSSVFIPPIRGNNILLPSDNLVAALSAAMPDVAKLAAYVAVLVVASYIVFMRRDVA
ncbi:MAG: ABC transporter permease [Methanocella sp.]